MKKSLLLVASLFGVFASCLIVNFYASGAAAPGRGGRILQAAYQGDPAILRIGLGLLATVDDPKLIRNYILSDIYVQVSHAALQESITFKKMLEDTLPEDVNTPIPVPLIEKRYLNYVVDLMERLAVLRQQIRAEGPADQVDQLFNTRSVFVVNEWIQHLEHMGSVNFETVYKAVNYLNIECALNACNEKCMIANKVILLMNNRINPSKPMKFEVFYKTESGKELSGGVFEFNGGGQLEPWGEHWALINTRRGVVVLGNGAAIPMRGPIVDVKIWSASDNLLAKINTQWKWESLRDVIVQPTPNHERIVFIQNNRERSFLSFGLDTSWHLDFQPMDITLRGLPYWLNFFGVPEEVKRFADLSVMP